MADCHHAHVCPSAPPPLVPLVLLTALLLLAGAVLAGLWLAIERAPRVGVPGAAVSLDDIARARRLLAHNDPTPRAARRHPGSAAVAA